VPNITPVFRKFEASDLAVSNFLCRCLPISVSSYGCSPQRMSDFVSHAFAVGSALSAQFDLGWRYFEHPRVKSEVRETVQCTHNDVCCVVGVVARRWDHRGSAS